MLLNDMLTCVINIFIQQWSLLKLICFGPYVGINAYVQTVIVWMIFFSHKIKLNNMYTFKVLLELSRIAELSI